MARATVLLASVLFSLLALAGCNNLEPHQDPRVARVLVAHEPSVHRSAIGYAPMILPYSLIEEKTYVNSIYRDFYPVKPKSYVLKEEWRCKQSCYANAAATRILADWRLVDALQYPFDKPHPYVENGGMDVQIWVTRGKTCKMAVLAFRGMDKGDRADMIANFHWFGRLVGVKDEYKEIRNNISILTGKIKELPCHSPQTEIIAVGHSLGGGLAQHINYVDPSIDSVIVFDPSFVTGSWEIPRKQRDRFASREIVTRVYEHGEILAYPRFILRNIALTTDHDPRVEYVRFNVVEGNLILQHKLAVLNTCLLNLTKSGPGGLPVEDPGIRGRAPDEPICNPGE